MPEGVLAHRVMRGVVLSRVPGPEWFQERVWTRLIQEVRATPLPRWAYLPALLPGILFVKTLNATFTTLPDTRPGLVYLVVIWGAGCVLAVLPPEIALARKILLAVRSDGGRILASIQDDLTGHERLLLAAQRKDP